VSVLTAVLVSGTSYYLVF